MSIEALIGHLKHAADIGRLVLVEKQIGSGRVGVDTVCRGQKAERDQRVEKVASGSGMQAEAAGQRFEVFGMPGKFGEDLHLDGAEQRLGGPEAQADLEDVIWPDV